MKKNISHVNLGLFWVSPILFLIRFYQAAISPHFPPTCRHLPTCSEYAYEAYRKWGVFRGTFLTIRRLSTCHPLCEPRVDTVPDPVRDK